MRFFLPPMSHAEIPYDTQLGGDPQVVESVVSKESIQNDPSLTSFISL